MGQFVIRHSSLVIVFFALVLLAAPLLASAAKMPNIPYWGPFVDCTKIDCNSLNGLVQVALNIVSFGITIALFFAAPALFAWGGILLLISGASPSKREQGKKIITGTLIGVLITLFAFLIVQTFVSLLGISNIGGFSQ